MYFTSKELLGENPDLVKRFTEAMNESLAYADANPEEVREILPTYTKIGPEVIPDLVLPKWPVDINTRSVEAIAKLAEQEEVLPEKPDIADLMP